MDKLPTTEELEKKYPDYFFRYTGFHPTRRHAILRSAGTNQPGKYRSAQCGVGPHWAVSNGWQGVCSDEERAMNDSLALCRRCEVKLEGGSFGVGLSDKLR